MEGNKERKGWMAVPAFGEWDMKNGAVPNYSFDFSKIREIRKQNKIRGSSYGNEYELLQLHSSIIVSRNKVDADDDVKLRRFEVGTAGGSRHRRRRRYLRDHCPSCVKRFINYFHGCIGGA